MWKKLDRSAIADNLTIGRIITDNPDDPKEQYEIRSIQEGYFKAIHVNGKISIKGFPTKYLISGSWWVKE